MSTQLLDPEQVGAELRLTARQVVRRTHEEDWPHVRLSKKVIRFRREHVEQIVARYERTGPGLAAAPAGIPGQTARSRRRRRPA